MYNSLDLYHNRQDFYHTGGSLCIGFFQINIGNRFEVVCRMWPEGGLTHLSDNKNDAHRTASNRFPSASRKEPTRNALHSACLSWVCYRRNPDCYGRNTVCKVILQIKNWFNVIPFAFPCGLKWEQYPLQTGNIMCTLSSLNSQRMHIICPVCNEYLLLEVALVTW